MSKSLSNSIALIAVALTCAWSGLAVSQPLPASLSERRGGQSPLSGKVLFMNTNPGPQGARDGFLPAAATRKPTLLEVPL